MTARPLLLATAGLITTAIIALPSYAALESPAVGAAPAATPTRVPAAPGVATSTPAPGATSQSSTSQVPTGANPTSQSATGGVGGGATTPAPAATYTPPAQPGAVAAPTAQRISSQNRFAVRVTGANPSASWPDAANVFTAAELAQVIPGVSAAPAAECSTSSVAAGQSSARSTRCTLNLSIPSRRAQVPSQIMVVVRGFGPPAAIGRGWNATFAAQQERASRRPGHYTFYRNGSLGAAAAYTDGTTTRVLLQRGGIAGEIWFSGIGLTELKPDYLASRADYRARVIPALVQLLAAKMAPA